MFAFHKENTAWLKYNLQGILPTFKLVYLETILNSDDRCTYGIYS